VDDVPGTTLLNIENDKGLVLTFETYFLSTPKTVTKLKMLTGLKRHWLHMF